MMAQLPRLERRVKNVRNTQLALTFSIAMLAIACFTSPSWGFAEACTGQGITTTPASRGASSYELYRKQLDSAGTANVDLILLGDSLAQGWDSSLFTPTIKTMNLGLGGDKTQNVLWRLDLAEWARVRPVMVFIMLGTNNLPVDPACAIIAGLKKSSSAQGRFGRWLRLFL